MSGLLQKKDDSYKNSRLAATALNAGHAGYRGGYLDLIKSHWTDWLRLSDSVRSGLPIDHAVPDSPDYRRRFTWAGLSTDVERYVASCNSCQRNKPSQQLTPGLSEARESARHRHGRRAHVEPLRDLHVLHDDGRA